MAAPQKQDEPMNSRKAVRPLALRMAQTVGNIIICAPPGFGKSTLIDEAIEIARKNGATANRISKINLEAGTGASLGFELSNEPIAGQFLAVDCIGREEFQALEIHLLSRGYPRNYPPLWIAINRPDDLNIARLIAERSAELIDHRSLLLPDSEVKKTLGRIAPPFKKAVGELSEGWPIALMLLCRWAQTTPAVNASWSGSDIVAASGLGGFISSEVAPLLEPEELIALVHSSVVSEIDLGFVGKVDPAIRRHLVNASLSLGGLVNRLGNRLQLQPAFRAWLKGRFDALPLEQQQATVERSAFSLAEQGRLIEAARLLKQGGKAIRIAELVESGGSLRIWMDHGYSAIQEIVEQAGDAVVNQSTSLQLMYCIVLMKSGRIVEAKSLIAKLDDSICDDPSIQRDREIVRATLLVYGCGLQGETDLDRFRKIVAASAAEPSWRSLLSTLSCILHTQRGRFDAAQASLIDARVNARSAESEYNLMFLSLHEASISLAKGELKLARIAIADARKRWRHAFSEDKGAETVLAALTASLEYELGQITSARNSVRRSAFRMPDSEAWFDIYAAAYEPMARIIALDHGVGPAIEALEDQRRKLISHGLPRVANLLLNMAHILVGEEWLREECSFTGTLPAIASIEPTATWHEQEMHRLATAYALMRQGDTESADISLKEGIGAAKRLGLMRSVLRFRLARASLLMREGRANDGRDELSQALKLGARKGAKQLFAHHRTPQLARAIDSFVGETRESRSNVARFAASLGFTKNMDAEGSGTLSLREKEVLAALAEGGSDKVLGRTLGMSEHGVRFHLKNIYRKLEVHDRASAIHRGRLMGQI